MHRRGSGAGCPAGRRLLQADRQGREPEPAAGGAYLHGFVLKQPDASASEVFAYELGLSAPVIVVAQHRVDAEWRAKLLERPNPCGNRNLAGAEPALERAHIVAQKHNGVGL